MTYTMMQVCRELGMTYQTLKFYCNQGLVPYVKRDKNNRRVFDEHDVEWVRSLTCLKRCGMSIEEMRDYLQEGDFSEEFVPSDYDADNDCLVESITYADEALSDEDVAEPEAEEEEVTEEKSEGNNMAAMAVGAVVIIGVCAYVIYRRKKA